MSSSADLNSKQLAWAKQIVGTIKAMKLPSDQGQRAADIALAVVRVESNFKMYANGNNPASMRLPHDAVGWDHGSVGLFQQQVGGAPNSTANWGTTAQCMDVGYSTRKFVNTLLHRDWLHMSNGQAAQSVQGSAFPDRYAAQDRWAIELRKELWGGSYTPAPAPKPSPKPVPKPSPSTTYVVRSGDTLSSIAARFHTTWQALQKLNGIPNANLIYVGQRLRISNSAPAKTVPVTKVTTTYTVRRGDTLSGIASRYHTSWKTLQKLNNIRNPNLIYVGQKIRIG
jgi:LysM repeat protein